MALLSRLSRVLPFRPEPESIDRNSAPRSVEEAFARIVAARPPEDVGRDGPIVLVISSLSPGGAERQAANTAIGLRRRGLDVALLAASLDDNKRRDGFHLPRLAAAGVPACAIEQAVTRGDDPRVHQALADVAHFLPEAVVVHVTNLMLEFQRRRPAIVHAWLDRDNVCAGLAALLAGVPKIVLSGRNLNPSRYSFNQPFMRPGYQALATAPQIVLINNSRAGADDYARWLGIAPGRIGVVANGLAFDAHERLPRAAVTDMRSAFGIPPEAFLIGGVFRLVRQKRPMLWLEVASRIAAALPHARFLIHGHGSHRAAMEDHIRALGLTDLIVLADVTDNPLAAMSMFDLLLLTSRGEGLPNVLIEAQSIGTPVVATRVGGTPEAVCDGVTGWIVDDHSAEAIAAKIMDLHRRSDLLKQASAAGPAFVRERFALDRMIASTLDVYGLSAAPARMAAE